MTNEEILRLQRGTLPELLGIEWPSIAQGRVEGRMAITPHHLAPNGFLHAASIITLADTACGYGCMASLPDGARNFTTIELKSNFVGTTRAGAILCTAQMVHGGRSTQLWDATVTNAETGKTIALFRCTQMILRD